tara:strand:+ start:3574 stop:4038 length:465 start_codon:yes stop_codon:yes gene_type:complete
MTRRISNSVPTSLRAAFELDKAHALKRKRLNVERLAELLGTTPATLYKWIETDSMPVRALIAWQHLTGSNHVVRYLASREGAVVIQIPPGRNLSAEDIHDLQMVLAEAPGALLKLKRGEIERDECMGALTTGMESLAWHRANVEKSDQPELELN